MGLTARLKQGETLADRVMKVDHAGEHGAICVYTTQLWIARWRAPEMVHELGHFLEHERQHRAIFAAQLDARNKPRCRSYHLCGIGGAVLGLVTGLMGGAAIAATTVAIERVVLRHLEEQFAGLKHQDCDAAAALQSIIADEQEHHDASHARIGKRSVTVRVIDGIVSASTEAVIWLGMRL